jgi:ABC-2 type transport system permease protein
MTYFSDVFYLFLRHVRATRRMPIFLVMSIVQPILWMALFSQLFRAVTAIPGFEASSYVQFLAPGIAIMSAMFGSIWSGMGLLVDLDRGVLDRMLVTPVSRSALIVARVAHSGATVIVQSAVILIMARLLGARPHNGFIGFAVVLVAASTMGAAFGGVSNGVALMVRRTEVFIAVLNFMTLPMTFLSSMIMSRNLMPGWIRAASTFNPLNWAVLVARNGFEGRNWDSVALYFALLCGFCLLTATLATRAFRHYRSTL